MRETTDKNAESQQAHAGVEEQEADRTTMVGRAVAALGQGMVQRKIAARRALQRRNRGRTDAVVAGGSAEALLDRHVSVTAAASRSVQRLASKGPGGQGDGRQGDVRENEEAPRGRFVDGERGDEESEADAEHGDGGLPDSVVALLGGRADDGSPAEERKKEASPADVASGARGGSAGPVVQRKTFDQYSVPTTPHIGRPELRWVRLRQFLEKEGVLQQGDERVLGAVLAQMAAKHMADNPKRFPPWIRYMVLNFTGLDYGNSQYQHGDKWRAGMKADLSIASTFTKGCCDQIGDIAQRARGRKNVAVGLRGKAQQYRAMRGAWSGRKPTVSELKPGATVLWLEWVAPGTGSTERVLQGDPVPKLTDGEVPIPNDGREVAEGEWRYAFHKGKYVCWDANKPSQSRDAPFRDLIWRHEATVAYLTGKGEVACFETHQKAGAVPGPGDGAGMRYFDLKSIVGARNVFVGYAGASVADEAETEATMRQGGHLER